MHAVESGTMPWDGALWISVMESMSTHTKGYTWTKISGITDSGEVLLLDEFRSDYFCQMNSERPLGFESLGNSRKGLWT